VAISSPRATTSVKLSFLETSHSTVIGFSGIPPLPASGDGAKRVHSTTPSGVGSPDATASVNG
jgi:hypothetical protein